jgi:hypothetical protein
MRRLSLGRRRQQQNDTDFIAFEDAMVPSTPPPTNPLMTSTGESYGYSMSGVSPEHAASQENYAIRLQEQEYAAAGVKSQEQKDAILAGSLQRFGTAETAVQDSGRSESELLTAMGFPAESELLTAMGFPAEMIQRALVQFPGDSQKQLDFCLGGGAFPGGDTGVALTPAPTAPSTPVSFTVQAGPMGINVDESDDPNFKVRFNYYSANSVVEQQVGGRLVTGMVITAINNFSMLQVSYPQVRQTLQQRPITITFSSSTSTEAPTPLFAPQQQPQYAQQQARSPPIEPLGATQLQGQQKRSSLLGKMRSKFKKPAAATEEYVEFPESSNQQVANPAFGAGGAASGERGGMANGSGPGHGATTSATIGDTATTGAAMPNQVLQEQQQLFAEIQIRREKQTRQQQQPTQQPWQASPPPQPLQQQLQTAMVTVPQNSSPGHMLRVKTTAGHVRVEIPAGVLPGQQFQIRLPAGHSSIGSSSSSSSSSSASQAPSAQQLAGMSLDSFGGGVNGESDSDSQRRILQEQEQLLAEIQIRRQQQAQQEQAQGAPASAPASASAAPAAMVPATTTTTMQVQVPLNAIPGGTLQVQAPSGQLVLVTIPPNTLVGSVLQVQVPGVPQHVQPQQPQQPQPQHQPQQSQQPQQQFLQQSPQEVHAQQYQQYRTPFDIDGSSMSSSSARSANTGSTNMGPSITRQEIQQASKDSETSYLPSLPDGGGSEYTLALGASEAANTGDLAGQVAQAAQAAEAASALLAEKERQWGAEKAALESSKFEAERRARVEAEQQTMQADAERRRDWEALAAEKARLEAATKAAEVLMAEKEKQWQAEKEASYVKQEAEQAERLEEVEERAAQIVRSKMEAELGEAEKRIRKEVEEEAARKHEERIRRSAAQNAAMLNSAMMASLDGPVGEDEAGCGFGRSDSGGAEGYDMTPPDSPPSTPTPTTQPTTQPMEQGVVSSLVSSVAEGVAEKARLEGVVEAQVGTRATDDALAADAQPIGFKAQQQTFMAEAAEAGVAAAPAASQESAFSFISEEQVAGAPAEGAGAASSKYRQYFGEKKAGDSTDAGEIAAARAAIQDGDI